VQVRPRLAQVLGIMSAMCRGRQVDPGLVDLLPSDRVREDCVRMSLEPAQVDDVRLRCPRLRPAVVIC
jgi:hypothetical protein